MRFRCLGHQTSRERSWRCYGWVVLCCLAFAALVSPASAAESSGDSLRASLVTIGPGDAIYEKFGHNAIWLHDPSQPPEYRDLAFHYGLFEFDSTFLFRFVQKHLRYSIGVFDYQGTLDGCRRDSRSVRVQELNLSQDELRSLRRFLHWNSRPENAEYDYDYYRDNCSTRVRDALSKAAGDDIRRQSGGITQRTYRDETRRLLKGDLIAYTAVDFMLGPSGDRPLSQWDLMFLPQVIADELPHMRRGTSEGVAAGEGSAPPSMLLSDNVVFAAARPTVAESPPEWTLRFLVLGLAMGALLLACLRLPRLLTVLLVIWSLFIGLSGLLLVYFICFSAHTATAWNLNFLHGSPLSLVLAFWVPGALRRGLRIRAASAVAAVICLGSVLAALAALLLQLPQRNGPFIAWLLPINTAVVIILWRARLRHASGQTALPFTKEST